MAEGAGLMADIDGTDGSSQTKRQTKTKPPAKRKGGRPRRARGAANTSDAANARWTVRGIPSNVRDIATKTAENRGMTVGDWLAETIVKVSRADTEGVSADVPGPTLEATVKALNERLTKIESDRSQSLLGRLFGRRG